ncbi:MAG: aminomethyl-transferring glycine dehydrogenase subunit GcvPB [Planctomycetia bacterium]|nr:aminomethyl-transferring glycine dehydrogenase subunit GcvPB [Planctomycetia bacterium]
MDKRQSTQLLFELHKAGRRCHRLPECDVPALSVEKLIPKQYLADRPLPLPEVAESDVLRHYVNLSTQNMSVDTNFYPLGSCTMKYNPKRHERLASMSGIVDLHPLQSDASSQGMLELLYGMQQCLGEIAGLPAVSLQPSAGAQGELAALLVAAAYFKDKNEKRHKVLVPDSAHGTNPASAVIAGFEVVTVKSDEHGLVNFDDLKAKLNNDVAVFMITNPNTCGLFETKILEITKAVHAVGGLVYLDGANMNAILGRTRPGDFGADMMHYNVHKTFTGPHGAGGPGAGPIAVRDFLAPFLPTPIVAKKADGSFYLDDKRPKSIGRVRSFNGNIGILVRGYIYIRTLGPEGLREISEQAVLNANYLLARLKDHYEVPHGDRCMHEFVASARKDRRERRVSAMDIAKRLLDYGFHAPTVYFPLIIPEALMIEPTETESKETLDAFADTLIKMKSEDPALLQSAPQTLTICRPDEAKAAREPILKWVGSL